MERARLNEEISQLKELLESTRTARREALEQSETAKQETDVAKRQIDALQSSVHSLESEKAEVRCSAICSYGFLTVGVSALQLERTAQDKSAKLTVERKTVASLKQDLDARISELEQLRKIANRDQPLSPATQRDSVVSTTSRTSRHDHPEEEIAGLKCVSFTCLIRKKLMVVLLQTYYSRAQQGKLGVHFPNKACRE